MKRIIFWLIFCLFFFFLGYFTVYYFDKQIDSEEHAKDVENAYTERKEHLIAYPDAFYLIDEAEPL